MTLSRLSEKELAFTSGAPLLKLNPNGDFEVEAPYISYTKLSTLKASVAMLL